MKLHLSTPAGQILFTGYGPGYVTISGSRHEKNIIVTPDEIRDWNITGFDSLKAADFESLVTLQPEIVIFGTGAILRFPHRAVSKSLAAAGVGLEVMDTRAACRTFNILIAEGRKVAAAMLVE